MHHCHVNSTSRRHIERVLGTLAASRAEGSAVSVEAYPFGAGSTAIGAAFLAPERLASWGLVPQDLVLLPENERIRDAAHLSRVRREDGGHPCVVEFLDEQNPVDLGLLQRSLAFPDSIVASDAMPVLWSGGVAESREWPLPPGGNSHPRTSATFAKALRMMVHDLGEWSWVEAFRRCSYLPSRVLSEMSPDAARKGHLSAGADADLVVLDPDQVRDVATFADPIQPSRGVRHLLVGGQFVIRDRELVPDAYPGAAVRGTIR